MWGHCPRASNGLLPRRSNLVGYVRWDARSDQFPPCQTIIPTALQVAIRFADNSGTGPCPPPSSVIVLYLHLEKRVSTDLFRQDFRLQTHRSLTCPLFHFPSRRSVEFIFCDQ